MNLERERTANLVDRKGNTALQGIFPGKEFNHLIGTSINMENACLEDLTLRELLLLDVFNTYVRISRLKSEEKAMQEFSHKMSLAFAEVQHSRGREKMKLIGEVIGGVSEERTSIRIYSRPRIKGVRVTIEESQETIAIDFTKQDVEIKIKEEWWDVGKFRKMDITAFLKEEAAYYSKDTEYTEQQVAIGRRLEEAIFGRSMR